MTPGRWGDRRRARIGLLGGSFNPAHAGHLHVAETALRRLRLDEVWLLVSPGNPLKRQAGMAPFAARRASAERLAARNRRLIVTDIESRLGTRYTKDTLRTLRQRFPRARFVWLMGADNLLQFAQWRDFVGIAHTVPFAILPRPAYTFRGLASRAAVRLRHARRPARNAPILAASAPPAWVFVPARTMALSATALRRGGNVGRETDRT